MCENARAASCRERMPGRILHRRCEILGSHPADGGRNAGRLWVYLADRYKGLYALPKISFRGTHRYNLTYQYVFVNLFLHLHV